MAGLVDLLFFNQFLIFLQKWSQATSAYFSLMITLSTFPSSIESTHLVLLDVKVSKRYASYIVYFL